MQEDTSFRGDAIGLCISIKGRHTEGKGIQRESTNGVKFQHSRLLSTLSTREISLTRSYRNLSALIKREISPVY